MSWDIWITCFHKGEVGKFPREILDRALEPFSTRNEDWSWALNECSGRVYIGNELQIDGFSVNRPPGFDHPFWSALIEVLKQTTCVLYWPGKGCVVADKSVIPHISAEFDETMGTPTVTTDIRVIKEMIRNA
ncbi:MAG TPA: hypothetical protein VJN67_06285 [Stellaceae bacterium]|nr:hypothetical protein [Stellaceae bacterium]